MRQTTERHQIDTAAKRAKLPPRRNPYWTSVSGPKGGLTLGYRRLNTGKPGTWVAKVVIANNRFEQVFGVADDRSANEGALSYSKAVSWVLDWARQKAHAVDDQTIAGAAAPTVFSVCAAYIAARRRDDRPVKSGLKKHLKADSKLAQTKLSRLAISDLEIWRDAVAKVVKSSHTVNRCLSDMRAALNRAADEHHATLPARFRETVRLGCRHLSAPTNARKQILTDDKIAHLVDKSFLVDEDLGSLSMVEASSGARFSQVNRLKVRDLQMTGPRLMMPTSNKGRGEKAIKEYPCPIGQDVADHLFSLTIGRDPDETLLMHWKQVQLADGSWVRGERVPWKANTYSRDWKKVLDVAELPSTIVMYAFRHSSIVRALRANIPIRMVAAMHDTSVGQIEKHYSAFITEISEDLARRSIIPLAPKKTAQAPTKTKKPTPISKPKKTIRKAA